MKKMNPVSVKKKLISFLLREITKAGFKKGLIGLSGGVDSAVAAFLAAEALGSENVTGIIIPYKTSSRRNIADAESIIRILGIKSEVTDITGMADIYISKHPKIDRVRIGNILARLRMIILYDISARENALVIGTSNKTEILLGYGTIYGDTACAVNPLGDLYKTQVWELAKYLGVPRRIIDKIPTADLWRGQTDEGELGFSYKDADRLLYNMIEKKCCDSKLIRLGFDAGFVRRVKHMVRRNKFKQFPPVIARLNV